MQVDNPFLVFVTALNRLKCPYMVTGSVAATLYGEPRFTHDVDLVLELPASAMEEFAAAFPVEQFYCPPLEVIVAESRRPQRGHFNLIHHATGMKADIYLAGRDALHQWGMQKRRRLTLDGVEIQVAPPEYVILRKLEYYREGFSEKHLLDSRAIVAMCNDIDRAWMSEMAQRRGLSELLAKVFSEGSEDRPVA